MTSWIKSKRMQTLWSKMNSLDLVKKAKEPQPPTKHIRTADHHWLDAYDIDGHYKYRAVLQWNPGAKRWSHSGQVGSGCYVNTEYWVYLGYCPIPEFN